MTPDPKRPKPRTLSSKSGQPDQRHAECRAEWHGLFGGITYSCGKCSAHDPCAGAVRADVEHVREPGMATKEIPKKAQVVLRRWIEHYEPDVIAVEQAFFAQSKRSRHLQRITQAITIVAKAKCLPVQLYPPTIVRRLICKQGRPTRLAVARVIATEYFPWLQPYYDKEAKKSWWRKHYWTHLFDAIAVGLACHAQAGTRRRVGRAA